LKEEIMFSTDIIYDVVTFSVGDTKAGTKMGKLQLKDNENDEILNCILWEETLNRLDSKLFRCGNKLRIVSGSFNEKYNNCLVSALELIEEALTGLSSEQAETYYNEIFEYANKITEEKLKNFVIEILKKHEKLLKISPAAKLMHHNYVGGLLVHTLECLQIADTVFLMILLGGICP